MHSLAGWLRALRHFGDEPPVVELGVGQLGFVRSTTLRAFDEAEFQAILGQMR